MSAKAAATEQVSLLTRNRGSGSKGVNILALDLLMSLLREGTGHMEDVSFQFTLVIQYLTPRVSRVLFLWFDKFFPFDAEYFSSPSYTTVHPFLYTKTIGCFQVKTIMDKVYLNINMQPFT